MVTGASSGIGKATAEALAGMGATVYLVCRDEAKAAAAVTEIAQKTGNKKLHALLADLSETEQVQLAAQQFLSSGSPLHILINNAGSVFGAKRQLSSTGSELTFALNHLGHFALTLSLLERLAESTSARIVNVASDAYRMAKGRFDFDDYNGEGRYSAARQYGLSKLANILFTQELARRVSSKNIAVNAAIPGLTASNFGKNTGPLGKILMGLVKPFTATPQASAKISVDLAAASEMANVSGRCFSVKGAVDIPENLCSEIDAKKLWELSERLTGTRCNG